MRASSSRQRWSASRSARRSSRPRPSQRRASVRRVRPSRSRPPRSRAPAPSTCAEALRRPRRSRDAKAPPLRAAVSPCTQSFVMRAGTQGGPQGEGAESRAQVDLPVTGDHHRPGAHTSPRVFPSRFTA
eukprot:6302671-Prymnesium_polylepis.1